MLPIRKLTQISMVAKLRYVHFIYILIGFQLIGRKCECTTNSSTNASDAIAPISDTEIVHNETATTISPLPIEARKLSDDAIESITSDSNALNAPSELLTDEQITNHEFQYYNEPTTTNAYEPSYVNHHHSPVHHHLTAVHIAKPLNKTYFATPMRPASYAPTTNNYMPSGNPLRIMQITSAPPWFASTSSELSSSSSSSSSHELMHLPYLENQYMASFRNIKSSVMNIIYKVQDFMSYVMGFFTTDETPMIEGRKKKKKFKHFKMKKKFKKFLIPLLLAYKLKFLTLIPLVIGGLILLVGSTGMAGFFFALFTAVITIKHKG